MDRPLLKTSSDLLNLFGHPSFAIIQSDDLCNCVHQLDIFPCPNTNFRLYIAMPSDTHPKDRLVPMIQAHLAKADKGT
jgi:hypothetical protein